MNPTKNPWSFISFLLTLCLLVGINGCKKKSKPNGENSAAAKAADQRLQASKKVTSKLNNMIATEDLILDLSPRLGAYAGWLEKMMSGDAKALMQDFSACDQVFGLLTSDPQSVLHASQEVPSFVRIGHWPIATEPTSKQNPWQALESLASNWATTKIGVVSGSFSDDTQTRFVLKTKSESRGAAKDGKAFYGLKGQQELTFEKKTGRWELVVWKQTDLKVLRSDKLMFEETLATALPDEIARKKAVRSYMDEIILKTSKSGTFELPDKKYVPWSTMTADHVFPSVAVVDYDNDGFQDLFLTARWGPTQMLRNQGDGTFEDVTNAVGLKFDFLVNCVLFADFDNDGDADVMLGRPMEPALYYRNEGGQYVDVTDACSDLKQHEQYFVSAISVTDVNRDGLLDVYFSTYPPLAKMETGFEHHFLNEFERKKYVEKRDKSDRWVDTPGTSNLLMINQGGGKFKRVAYDEIISQWRRSYQAVWGDVDNDGDDDLYVCNDFAPDALLRNDTPQGAMEPVFTDVTQESLIAKGIAFGMGASFGDFDRDGDMDLYVSNMFSKAGNRIFKKLDSVDPRLLGAAAGCFLFENRDGKLFQSAGKKEGQFAVNQVGWSYGGQWTDLNNDGQLDIYVPTGFFTAPDNIDTKVDL